jgi:hypothetical protein
MSLAHRYGYLQARLQARYAGLPSEDDWQRLAATRTLSAFLEEARMGVLRAWVAGFSSQSETHDLEAAVRTLYRETAGQVASWVPKPWCDAVAWVRWLPVLPIFDHLARGEPMPAWVAWELDMQTLLEEDGTLSLERLRRAGAAALGGSSGNLADAWLGQWRRRWPRCDGQDRANMESLVKVVEDAAAAFLRAPPEGTWTVRKELRERLRLRFHQQLLQPVTAFIYLALVALDLERLRAGLVTRALFAEPEMSGP